MGVQPDAVVDNMDPLYIDPRDGIASASTLWRLTPADPSASKDEILDAAKNKVDSLGNFDAV